MGNADAGGGGSGLDGSLAKEMARNSVLERNGVFPRGPGTAKGTQLQPLWPRRPQPQTHQNPLPLWWLL